MNKVIIHHGQPHFILSRRKVSDEDSIKISKVKALQMNTGWRETNYKTKCGYVPKVTSTWNCPDPWVSFMYMAEATINGEVYRYLGATPTSAKASIKKAQKKAMLNLMGLEDA